MNPLRWLYTIPLRLRSIFRSDQLEHDLDDELRDHLEQKSQHYIADGLSPEDARRAALRDIDGLELRKEQCRDTRRTQVIEHLLQDFRFGFRMLRKSPAFTATAVLMLGLGIGANTAIFSVVNAVMLRPLPFPEPDRIVRVESTIARTGETGGVSYPDFLDWRARNDVFQQMAALGRRGMALSGAGTPVRLQGVIASADLFPLLGIAPASGRWFSPEEDRPGAAGGANAAILSDRAWREYFRADPSIVGRFIRLDQAPFQIVGVMPSEFQFPVGGEPVDVWTTVAVDGVPDDKGKTMLSQRGVHYLEVVARLKQGATVVQAEAQMKTIVDALNRQYSSEGGLRGVLVSGERASLVHDVRTPLLLLLGAVGCVLLIACANLASLILSRAAARQREIAVRSALGASRARLIQQLAVEHICLAFLGGVCALFIAQWGVRVLLYLAPANVPRLRQAHLDASVLLFTAVASAVCALLLGLVPVLQLSKLNIVGAVKDGSRGQSQGAAHNRFRAALVVGQMAAAAVLLVAAGLLMQTLVRLLRVDPGFRSEHVLSFRADMPDSYSAAQQQAFYRQLIDRLRESPGVRSASALFSVPLSGTGFQFSYEVEGRDIAKSDLPEAAFNLAEPGSFQTLGIPFLSGRDFTAHDDLQSTPVVIINEALARELYPHEDPLGKRVRPGVGNGYPEAPLRTIIAVVGNVQMDDLRSRPAPGMWLPLAQCPHVGSMTLVVRTDRDPHSLISEAQSTASALDKSIPLFSIRTLDEYLAKSVAQPRFQVSLLASFALLSLLVATIGLYGAISYSVAQRRLEWGIRVALGAQRHDILRGVLRQGAALAIFGVAVGLLASFALTRLMSSLLFGVTPRDPLTFATVAALLTVVALLASYVPARRATRVDPIQALRHE